MLLMLSNHRLAFPSGLALALLLSPALLRSAELTGEGSAGNWQADAPGVRHHVRLEDLPKPYVSPSAQNSPKVVVRPEGAALHVPAGFEVRQYADGLRNPGHPLTAPNGDIFVGESEADEIRILRESKQDGNPDINRVFLSGLNKPFGLALYPPGDHPQYLY
jgi:glucose/arabinose dehydrogenase